MRPSPDTLVAWTGAPCSYGCAACPIDPSVATAGISVADLQQALAGGRVGRGRLVVLVGGEPFLRSDVLRLVAAIRAAGCVPGMVTTGRALVYAPLRVRLRRAGLAYLRVQLFGVSEAHDRAAAVPGAFEQAVEGLRAWLSEAGADCDVDVALSTRGGASRTIVSDVEQLAHAIDSPSAQIVVSLDPLSGASRHDSEPLRRAIAALAGWNDDARRPLLVWEGLPPSDAVPPTLMIPPLLASGFVGAATGACCLGTLEAAVAAGASPPVHTQANSFNYVRTETSVPWTADAAACTAFGATAGRDPDRHLWLIDGGRLLLHATDTGDFTPPDIARIKNELSHLFVDRAPAGVLDDFTEGMRRVLPDTSCAPCVHRVTCGRRYRVVDGPPFAREEAWIADHITRLRGRVLDVGCGEQLYRDQLAPLVRSGAVDYTGLDPDEPSLAALRTALSGGRFYAGGIEDFRDTPGSYDHILCLRSLNHVFDLDEAVARMAGLLRPGGELLIVETIPFAMLRRPEQVAAADRAPRAGHQHFRNVASEAVVPLARRRSLRVLHHQPASLAATNEWILLLGRPPAAPPSR